MAKNKSKQDLMFEEEDVYVKNTKHKSAQYDKCRNYDCDENDDGFCCRYKNKAKHTCKKFR